jgi:hypothetical protein
VKSFDELTPAPTPYQPAAPAKCNSLRCL